MLSYTIVAAAGDIAPHGLDRLSLPLPRSERSLCTELRQRLDERGVTVDVSHTSSWPVQVAARQRRLRVINIAVGLLLGVEGALMLALSNMLTLPITTSYLTNDPVAVRGPTMPERLFALPIGPTVAVFLLLAAVDHLVVASPGVQQWYLRSLERSPSWHACRCSTHAVDRRR